MSIEKRRHIYDVICPLYIESLLIFLFKIDIKANKLTLIFKFKIQELHQYIYIRCNVFSEIRITQANFFGSISLVFKPSLVL